MYYPSSALCRTHLTIIFKNKIECKKFLIRLDVPLFGFWMIEKKINFCSNAMIIIQIVHEKNVTM